MNNAKALVKSLLLLLLLLVFLFHCSYASSSSSDTLTLSQTLKDDGSVLVSNGSTYTLGFFSPGKSTSRYLGIWFSFSNDTVVWMANRDKPLKDTSGVLSLGRKSLVLSGNSSLLLWSVNTNSSSSTGDVSVKLFDTGNLVLFLNGEIIWQSYDHPTNVLLTGMKVGLDLRTGLNRIATAWKSPDDPGTGTVSLRMDPAGSPQLFLYKNMSKLWRAGHWNGLGWSGIPSLAVLPRKRIFSLNFVNDEDEITVAWNVLDRSIMTYVMVDTAGHIKQLTWQPEAKRWVEIYSSPVDNCDNYAHCGPFGWCNPFNATGYECACLPGYSPVAPHDWALREGSEGCWRGAGPMTMCGAGEGFVKVENVKVPDAALASVELGAGTGIKECREECLRNCSCLGYGVADVRDGGTGCMKWSGGLMDVKQFLEGGQDLYVRVDQLELATHHEESQGFSWKLIAVIVGVGIGLSLICIGLILYLLKKRKNKKGAAVLGQPQTLLHNVSANSAGFDDSQGDNTRDKSDIFFFDFSTIATATDNFSLANKLGQGGFGSVYKGVLSNGQQLAVKRLSKFSGQGIEEFKNEVVLIAKLQHRNLVRLLGCCINDEEKMLVYEYLPNKSLDFSLFDKNRKQLLDWGRRSQIILGIARGLLYLHQDSRLKIIHRDLKASNVLLDGTMNPKISDFGMARMFGDDQLEANTSKVVGTYGYMSPEYAMEGLYSTKSDVFSFGVLMLEIITGKKNSHFNEVSSLNLVGQVWELWTEKNALELVDESLSIQSDDVTNQILRWIQIGLLCVQELAADRPTMLDAIFMLGNDSPLPSPKRPAFIYKTASSDTSTSKGVSTNNITVTVMEPR